MSLEHAFHLEGVHVLAARLHHIVSTADKAIGAVSRLYRQIPGRIPSVHARIERVEIAVEHGGRPSPQLPHLPFGYRQPLFVYEANRAERIGVADGKGGIGIALELLLAQVAGEADGVLGLPVPDAGESAGKQREHLPHGFQPVLPARQRYASNIRERHVAAKCGIADPRHQGRRQQEHLRNALAAKHLHHVGTAERFL